MRRTQDAGRRNHCATRATLAPRVTAKMPLAIIRAAPTIVAPLGISAKIAKPQRVAQINAMYSIGVTAPGGASR